MPKERVNNFHKLGAKLLQPFFVRPWLLPLLLSAVLSVLLIQRKFGLFSKSFLFHNALVSWQIPLFFAAMLLFDFAFLYLLYLACFTLAKLLRRSLHLLILIYTILSCFLVVVINFVSYQILSFLADFVQVKTAVNLADGWFNTIPYVSRYLPRNWPLMLLILVAVLPGIYLFYRLLKAAPSLELPRYLTVVKRAFLFSVLALLVQAVVFQFPGSSIQLSLKKTFSSRMLSSALASLSDFDADGYGMLDVPADKAPFIKEQYPFALDIPENGIDEDGIGGDVTKEDVSNFLAKRESRALLRYEEKLENEGPTSKPDIVLIVSCTFRADALDSGSESRKDMPNLNALAKRGINVPLAFSHAGHTTSSLQSILSGQLVVKGSRVNSSLIRDFNSLGYQTAMLSVQNEQFGSSRKLLYYDESDHYFDASFDPDARVTTYSIASSMMLPAKRLYPEIERVLDETKDEPLFMHVFLATSHYPYDHDSEELLVPHNSLDISEYRAENRDQLYAKYRNSIANLDRQIGNIVSLVESKRKNKKPIFVIMGDHGESFFDNGMLGHGMAINDLQTRVPLVVINGWGEIVQPFGHRDLRAYLLQLLTTSPKKEEKPKLVKADAPLLQWTSSFSRPQQLALTTSKGRALIDFNEEVFVSVEGNRRPFAEARDIPSFLEIVRTWELYRLFYEGKL